MTDRQVHQARYTERTGRCDPLHQRGAEADVEPPIGKGSRGCLFWRAAAGSRPNSRQTFSSRIHRGTQITRTGTIQMANESASLRAEIELTSWPLAKSKRIPFRAYEAFCAVMMAAPPPDAVSHSLGFLPRSIDTRSP